MFSEKLGIFLYVQVRIKYVSYETIVTLSKKSLNCEKHLVRQTSKYIAHK